MKRKFAVIVVFSLLSTSIFSQAQPRRGPRFSEWSAPVNLGAPINLPDFNDHAAVLSRDEKTIFFTSNRTGRLGGEDIWVATRRNKNSPWETPTNLGPIVNTAGMERVRTLSEDGRILLFQSDRVTGGQGAADLWAIFRKNANDNFGWSEPVNLGPVINTDANEIAGKYIFAGVPKLFFSSTRSDLGGLGAGDIYESEILADGSFGTPVNRFELNSPSIETCFWVRDDGLEIFFSSNRPNLNESTAAFDIWTSTRSSIFEVWSEPVNLGPTINAAGSQDVNPALSADGKTLLFSSRRLAGDMDIYMSTRRPVRRNP